MSKSNAFETALLNLIFNGEPIPNIADNAVASHNGNDNHRFPSSVIFK